MLGRGSSAEVRRAHDLRDGSLVAIKLFNVECSLHDRARQRRELHSWPGCAIRGWSGCATAAPTGRRVFVVTDLVEGPTLARRIRDGALEPGEVRRLGAQLAAGLAHVHDAGVVHRDVKPANVLLGDGTHARLADFGIAVAIDGTVATETGCVVGTVAYLSPEQARGETVGPPTDVWSLGLVLLEALTGRREYPGTAAEAAVARLHRRPELPRSARRPGCRPAGDDRADPAARPSAATVAGSWPRPPRWAGTHRRAARHRRGRGPSRMMIAVASAVLVGATGAALVALAPAQQQPPPVAVLDVPATGD